MISGLPTSHQNEVKVRGNRFQRGRIRHACTGNHCGTAFQPTINLAWLSHKKNSKANGILDLALLIQF